MAVIGVLFLGESSVDRVGVDVEEAGWRVGVEILAVVVAVVPIDVAVVVGRGCETDGCCDTKCGDFFPTKGAYSRTLKIKWKTKTAEDEDTRRNYDVLLLVEVDEEVNETKKDRKASFA